MARDVNGNPIEASRWKQWTSRLGGNRKPNAELSVDDPELVVTAESFDDSVAASTTLADSVWREDEQSVLRHFLAVPADAVDKAVALAAQDHYQRVPVPPAASSGMEVEGELFALARVQLIDALHVSQERSRMAGLAQRHGGTVLAWQVLQPPR
ncbi:hypothetical protein [Gordonia rubripertincta]|uniref:Uncharacterized protein n=1 Tax=Gordonia rubripertincta TaxID=36822 RepID=A0ABT4MQ01_GORRU|nr:hypothetical protein [Gordonia rubripertincta]MCZ4549058.1 hypothetical protein [Gordonia rubripertincta]